ncbi:MAG: FecR family protein [Verrucomicrobia bacterium]|nr:FecR family protein [Verrucomicrobiota bacterium]
MKNTLRLIVGGFIAALLSVAAQAAELAPGAITVGIAKGDVTYKIAGTTAYLPAPAGTALPQGATVKAGAGSTATLVFATGSVATIRPNTEVEITKFEQEAFSGPVSKKGEPSVSNTELKLIEGEVIPNVAKLKKGSQFVVNSPIGAAGVRGTIFAIKIDRATGAARITVLEGGVNLRAPRAVADTAAAVARNEILVSAGQSFEVPAPATVNGAPPSASAIIAAVINAIASTGTAPITPQLLKDIIAIVKEQTAVGAPNVPPAVSGTETTQENQNQNQNQEEKPTVGPTVPDRDVATTSLN